MGFSGGIWLAYSVLTLFTFCAATYEIFFLGFFGDFGIWFFSGGIWQAYLVVALSRFPVGNFGGTFLYT